MRPFACALLVAAWVGSAAAATAPDAGLQLTWEAPAECPQGDAVGEKVRGLLSGSPPAPEVVVARGVIRKEPGGVFRLTLDTEQGEQRWHRSIDAVSCAEVTDAGALILALAVDPELSQRREAPAPSPSPVGPEPAPPAPIELTPPPSARPEPQDVAVEPELAPRAAPLPLELSLAAALLADFGTLPIPGFGAELAAGLSLSPVRFELVGTALAPRRRIIRSDPDRGGDFDLIGGGLRGCYFRGERLRLSGCLGVELGRLRGEGVGAERVAVRHEAWLAGRVGLVADYALGGPLLLRGALEGLIPVTRPEFELDNVGSVHQPWPVIGRLAVGLEISFR